MKRIFRGTESGLPLTEESKPPTFPLSPYDSAESRLPHLTKHFSTSAHGKWNTTETNGNYAERGMPNFRSTTLSPVLTQFGAFLLHRKRNAHLKLTRFDSLNSSTAIPHQAEYKHERAQTIIPSVINLQIQDYWKRPIDPSPQFHRHWLLPFPDQ